MGGAAPTPSGKGGKKPLDAAINLVPFIDLLSCCISFLLITAVWTQLARMDVQQKGQGAAGAESEQKDPQKNYTLFIDKDGYILSASTGESTNIPLKDGDYDFVKLAEALQKAKNDVGPEKNDISIKADDAVLYDKIIHTIDTAITCGRPKDGERCFPDVALGDKGQGT